MTATAPPSLVQAMALAAGHILDGVAEIELTWELEAPTDEHGGRQLVITMRGSDRWASMGEHIRDQRNE